MQFPTCPQHLQTKLMCSKKRPCPVCPGLSFFKWQTHRIRIIRIRVRIRKMTRTATTCGCLPGTFLAPNAIDGA